MLSPAPDSVQNQNQNPNQNKKTVTTLLHRGRGGWRRRAAGRSPHNSNRTDSNSSLLLSISSHIYIITQRTHNKEVYTARAQTAVYTDGAQAQAQVGTGTGAGGGRGKTSPGGVAAKLGGDVEKSRAASSPRVGRNKKDNSRSAAGCRVALCALVRPYTFRRSEPKLQHLWAPSGLIRTPAL